MPRGSRFSAKKWRLLWNCYKGRFPIDKYLQITCTSRTPTLTTSWFRLSWKGNWKAFIMWSNSLRMPSREISSTISFCGLTRSSSESVFDAFQSPTARFPSKTSLKNLTSPHKTSNSSSLKLFVMASCMDKLIMKTRSCVFRAKRTSMLPTNPNLPLTNVLSTVLLSTMKHNEPSPTPIWRWKSKRPKIYKWMKVIF